MLTYRRPTVLVTREKRCKEFNRDCLHAKSAKDEEVPVAYAFIYSENAFRHEKVEVESDSK